MRNLYKVLSEKYDLIREQETVTPSASPEASPEGREIKGVFVPAEIEQWTDNVLRFPIWSKGGRYAKVIGYRKTDQNYTPGELKVIVNRIYNQWKDQPLEKIQQAVEHRGPIYNALKSVTWAKYSEKLTPEELQAIKDRKALNKQLKRTNIRQTFNTSTGQVQEETLKSIISTVLDRAAHRAREQNLPFFYNLNHINQPSAVISANKQKAVDYVYSIWPPDNRCPATGISFLLGTGTPTNNSPSLDKLIPDKGYVIGNVAIISKHANTIKNEGNLEQIKKVYNYSKEGNQILSGIKNHLNGFEGEIDNPVDSRGRTRLPQALRNAVKRTNKYGLPPIDINLKYLESLFPIKSAMVCPVLGIPLIWSEKKTNNTPSLDRIVPKLGYVKGNVVFISHLANKIKNDATTEQIEGVLNWMKKVGAWPDPD